ncbi:MAG: DUF58 domain-containing protein [Clostridia bacterium]
MNRTIGLLRDIAILVALAGLVTGRPSVVAAAVFVIGLWFLSNIFARQALRRMSTTQRLSPHAVPINEPADLAVSVTNAYNWPVPLLEWSDQLAEGVEAEAAKTATITTSEGRRQAVYGRYSMRRWEEVTQHVTVKSGRRGRYVLGPIYLQLRDPLGVTDADKTAAASAVLTVFPSLFSVPAALTMPTAPHGARRGPPWNPPDPTRYIGVRPYEPGDSPRLIHPYASARTGALQVKRLETEADDQVELVALAATAPYLWEGIDPDRLESLISATASAAHYYITQGAAVGLSLAGSVYGQPKGVALKPQAGKDQWTRIQTALAWVTPGGGEAGNLTTTLHRLTAHARPGTQVFVFTCYFSDAWLPYIERMRHRRLKVVWVAVGDRGTWPQIPGLRLVHWTPRVEIP